MSTAALPVAAPLTLSPPPAPVLPPPTWARPGAPVPLRRDGTAARRRPAPAPPRRAASGRLLLAAVAVGAVLPAAQTLSAHALPDAAAHAPIGASLALAAAQGGAGSAAGAGAAAAATALDGVTTVSLSDAELAGSAGRSSAALSKAASVTRETGTPQFGTPYAAGDEKTLDGQIAKALGLLGLPQKLAPGVRQIVMRESTGDPDAVNGWDSNAAAGTPSKGLMQLIEPTFRSAVLPSLADRGIYDPVANITAGVRTMIANHGMDTVMDGGRRNARGHYIGYGGAKLPTDGLGIATQS